MMMNTNTQPLFTLTAEEVEAVRQSLTRRMDDIGERSIDNLSLEEQDEWFGINALVAKIEQWQDENTTD